LSIPLTDEELEYLLDFVGLGKLNADVWFLGMEEAGGGEKNIRARLKFKQVEDCKEAHKILGITKHHSGKKNIQPTWRGMCYIMLRLEGKETDRESIRNYQADQLGRIHGNSLLLELMPIPKPSIDSWGYENFIPQFASSAEYYKVVKPRRIKHLQRLIRENTPKTIICYGKMYWQEYKEIFPEIEFLSKNEFLVGKDESKIVIMTSGFPTKAMNGKFDEVVSIIQNNS
jgi:hypothetical protein